MENNKLLSLESLRGIAAIFVALHHFKVDNHYNNNLSISAGLLVDFFFVLSGFVIYLSYNNRINKFSDIIVFQKKRFLRLYPLHFVTLLFLLFIEFAKYVFEIKMGVIANVPAFEVNNASSFIANIFLLQNWTVTNITFNGPSWSISAEFYTYLIFAVLLFSIKGKKFTLPTTLVAIVLTLYFFMPGHMLETTNVSGPLRCLYSFAIGTLIANIYLNFNLNGKISTGLPASILMVFSFVSVGMFGSNDPVILVHLPFLFGLTVLILVSTNSNTYINRILSNKVLVYFGTISYGIYMLHYGIFWVVVQTLRFVFKVPTVVGKDGLIGVELQSIWLGDAITLASFLIVILCSHFSYHYFEKRFQNNTAKKISSGR